MPFDPEPLLCAFRIVYYRPAVKSVDAAGRNWISTHSYGGELDPQRAAINRKEENYISVKKHCVSHGSQHNVERERKRGEIERHPERMSNVIKTLYTGCLKPENM